MNPIARRDDVIVHEVEEDTVCYDTRTHVAHTLGETTGWVYRHADGTRSVEALAAGMAERHDIPDALAITQEALAQLAEAGLLAQSVASTTRAAARGPVSRRAALQRLGVAAAVMPTILSMVVPTAAAAQSGAAVPPPKTKLASGQPCSLGDPGACASGCCTTDGQPAGHSVCC